MTRTILSLPEKDKQWLERFSSERRISLAESIRLAIRLLKEREGDPGALSILDRSAGILAEGLEDGLDYQRGIRDAWQ